tara:strand:+ start:345 stop:464 length:120 start_codon:yes stop_codon:yes gene_type:complete
MTKAEKLQQAKLKAKLELQIRRLNVQVRNRSWQRREQNA